MSKSIKTRNGMPRILPICIFISISVSTSLKSQDSINPNESKAWIKAVRAAVQYEVDLKKLPSVAIAVVADDEVWEEGFGFDDVAKTRRTSEHSVFRVGSISKLFTDIALMKLVESGQLNLDDPVESLLPNFKPNNPLGGVPITLRQLMTHQSGLVRESPVGHYFDDTSPSLNDTVNSLNGTPIIYPPGTKTKYSNAGIAVVGAIVESKLHEPHAQVVARELLAPLGMNHSSFDFTPEIQPHLASGWMWTYDDRRFVAPNFALGSGPAGNLYSSVHDLAQFIRMLTHDGKYGDKQIITSAELDRMTSQVKDEQGNPLPFGLGFRIGKLDNEKSIGHGGAIYGYSTQLEVLPERKIGVVVASALDGSNGVAERLAQYALRVSIAAKDGKALPQYRRTSPIPRERASQLRGKYVNPKDNRFLIVTELNGTVYVQREQFRQQLRVVDDNGEFIIDDPIGFGTELKWRGTDTIELNTETFNRVAADAPPSVIPERWRGLIGEYGWDHNTLYILEEGGQLFALIEWFYFYPLTEVSDNEFRFPSYGLYHGEGLKFKRDADDVATSVVAAEVRFDRREVGTKDGVTFQINPIRPVQELRAEALKAKPPEETGTFRNRELIELKQLDSTLKHDIRYATTNNFVGEVFYSQPRAFLQKPAAEAMVRVHKKLKPMGLGLLIHDAYRPWYVTKMFWEATPNEFRHFVANPANGSRHNRGCAVDLTLYDTTSGEPIIMPGGYDEFSNRSFPMYPGGTSRQRWYRDLLREAMEGEGFQVYEFEWWHFDFKDWKEYRINNDTFENLSR